MPRERREAFKLPYKLNGKFVSKEKYEAAMASPEKENIVSEPVEPAVKKVRTPSASTAALASVNKAKRELDRVKALHAKRTALPSVEDAQNAYDAAVLVLQDTLNI